MILSPTKDLSETELQMLTDYVQAGGDLFITVSYTDPDELPNFYALYRLYGFEPIPGLVLEDEARTDAYYESIPNLTPKMLATDATGTLVAAGYDTLILAGARALETPTQQDSALSVYVALESTRAHTSAPWARAAPYPSSGRRMTARGPSPWHCVPAVCLTAAELPRVHYRQ